MRRRHIYLQNSIVACYDAITTFDFIHPRIIGGYFPTAVTRCPRVPFAKTTRIHTFTRVHRSTRTLNAYNLQYVILCCFFFFYANRCLSCQIGNTAATARQSRVSLCDNEYIHTVTYTHTHRRRGYNIIIIAIYYTVDHHVVGVCKLFCARGFFVYDVFPDHVMVRKMYKFPGPVFWRFRRTMSDDQSR